MSQTIPTRCLIAATAASMFAATSAYAIDIDLFLDSGLTPGPQAVADDGGGFLPAGSFVNPAPGAIGGTRQMTVTNGTGVLGTTGVAGSDELIFSNSQQSAGELEIIYGIGVPALNADLTDGGTSTGFLIRVLSSDKPVDYTINMTSSDHGPITEISGTFPSNVDSPGVDVFIPFGLDNYTDIDSIIFTLTPTNNVLGADITLSNFRTGVPEPSSLALLGLGALAMMRRRR